MIPCDQPYNPEIRKRYRVLAGPFNGGENSLMTGLLDHLKTTGARITTVGQAAGVEVWRLRSECETLEDTARRLKKLKRR
jgi:hypothetical protein